MATVPMQSENILIVGGGASGALVAIALTHAGVNPEQITIAEPRELLGEGLAYQTRDPLHRLNVPSSKMSGVEDLPHDFSEWSGVPAYSFMERRSYSEYLRDRLDSRITHIKEKVINLDSGDSRDSERSERSERSGEVVASFANGQIRPYRTVVLAMGHGGARLPDFLRDLPPSPRVIRDVWDGRDLPLGNRLICFGTGLSFIDIALTHISRDPTNTVIGISGSGNLPERHVLSPITPYAPTLSEVETLEKLRSYLADAGDNWRQAIDGLRPITESMWRGFSPAEREEFLTTDGSAWSRRRHRIAPEVADLIESAIEAGRVRVIKGSVESLLATEEVVSIRLKDGSSFVGDHMAITIGREYAVSDPLSINLLADSKTLRGPLGMGLSVEVTTGRLLNVNGRPYEHIFAIGPLRSGEAFESSAIPEIRRQASSIAERFGHDTALS